MNQVVSAALVAQREVDEESAATNDQSGDGAEVPGARLDTNQREAGQDSESQDRGEEKVVQRLVCFVISLLQRASSRYSRVQKLIFGLIMASRKLRHYFQSQKITVVSLYLVQQTLAYVAQNIHRHKGKVAVARQDQAREIAL